MPSQRIDQVIFSSLYGAFLNYLTSTDTIVVAATSLASGAARSITVTIPYTRGGTTADIYATRGSVKTLITSGGRAAAAAVYSYVSSEIARFDVKYTSSNITVTLYIENNTGGAIVPTAQSIVISVVQYDAPVSSV